MVPSGYVLLRAAMTQEKAPLAGEMSGHIVVGDGWCRVDDALYVALRTLVALGRRGECLADFRLGLPRTASTAEIRLACPEQRKRCVVDEVAARLRTAGAQVDLTDGLRVTTRHGWWLLRSSGTEPKLALRCEAGNEDGLRYVCNELAEQLRLSGVDAPALLDR
jgi:phosphomannomutase